VPASTREQSVPTILVADDNSNIQKMVTLALKDLGVDVIAVGNGEAAIRKLPDTMPDMVLADIFMPVRNGYEVCQFIKQDGRYGHIPVVLLVGTFDPLDEKEVARVGADGVLKKPFVPPDALITTVRGTLEKLGLLSTKEESKERRRIPAPVPAVPPDWHPPGPPSPQPEAQPEPEEYDPRQMPVAFQGEEAPPAFSEFLESSSSTGTEEAAEANEEVAHPGKPPASDWRRFASEVAPEVPAFGAPEHGSKHETEEQEERRQQKPLVTPPPWEPGGRRQGETPAAGKEEGVEAAAPTNSRAFASPWVYPTGEEAEEEAPAVAAPESHEGPPATEATPPSKLKSAEAAIAEAAARVISFPEVAAEIFSGTAHEFGPGHQGETKATADSAPAAPSPQGPWNPPAPEASGAEAPPPTAPSKLDTATVDAVVERVMSQLRPQIGEMISRNVVRPIVTAILQREIEKHDE
jgi:CheY-like chemotaxis protein